MHNAVKRSWQAIELRVDARPSLFAKQTQAIIESLHGRYYVPFKKMKFWRDVTQWPAHNFAASCSGSHEQHDLLLEIILRTDSVTTWEDFSAISVERHQFVVPVCNEESFRQKIRTAVDDYLYMSPGNGVCCLALESAVDMVTNERAPKIFLSPDVVLLENWLNSWLARTVLHF